MQRARLFASDFARFLTHLIQPPGHLLRAVEHLSPGIGQGRALCGAFEQVHANPCLQRTDSSAERRLGHMTQLRSARKVAALCQRIEVFQPDQFHRDAVRALSAAFLALAATKGPALE